MGGIANINRASGAVAAPPNCLEKELIAAPQAAPPLLARHEPRPWELNAYRIHKPTASA
jgi:hypothetical protein